MDKVPLRYSTDFISDETADNCHWHINGTHYLEAVGRCARLRRNGSIMQPLIAPLYNGQSEYEVLSTRWSVAGPRATTLCASTGKARSRAANFEDYWRKALSRRLRCPTRRCSQKR